MVPTGICHRNPTLNLTRNSLPTLQTSPLPSPIFRRSLPALSVGIMLSKKHIDRRPIAAIRMKMMQRQTQGTRGSLTTTTGTLLLIRAADVGSDPSSNRPLITRRRTRRDESPDSELSEDEIEVLPDRFDAQGRPLDPRGRPVGGRAGDSRWHTRNGDFEYRSPRGRDGWNVRGQWGIGGTDPEAVERMVRGVTGAIQGGQGGWAGLLGGLLSGLQQPPDAHDQRRVEEDGQDDGSRRHDGRLETATGIEEGSQREESSRHGGRHRDRDEDDENDSGSDENERSRPRKWWKRKRREE